MTSPRGGHGRATIGAALVVAGVTAAAVAGLLGYRGPSPPPAAGSVVLSAELRGHLDTLPGRGSAGYRPSTARQRGLLAASFGALVAGDRAEATRLAAAIDFEVIAARSGDRTLLVLRDRRRPTRGWGVFVAAPGAQRRVVVEVVHPIADIATTALGSAIFDRAGATALLVAGAHRSASPTSDVAHEAGSPLQAVHRKLVAPGVVFIQPHGFADRSHVQAEAIVSSGTTTPEPLAQRVAAALRRAGTPTCVYAQPNCPILGGTSNVQGRSARADGAAFLHVELARRLRVDERLRARTAAAIASAAAR